MEYAVFKQQIMEQAKRILPQEEGYVITIVDQTEYGLGEMLIINKSDKEVVPGISMEEMYQDFSQNKKSIEEVIETIQDTVNTAFLPITSIILQRSWEVDVSRILSMASIAVLIAVSKPIV